jgi:hypothetical protein
MIDVDWRQPFIDYIHEQKVPTDKNLAEQIIRRQALQAGCHFWSTHEVCS